MAKYGTFQYGDGTKYGTLTKESAANLLWGFQVAWDGEYTGFNEASRMVDLTVTRGRRHPLGSGGFEPFAPGRAVGIFDNSDGRYDPWNTSSPLYPHISPGKFVRIAVKDIDNGVNYGVMRGIIEDIVSVKRGGRECTRIVVTDGLSWLQNKVVHVGLQQSIDKDDCAVDVVGGADWPWTEWPNNVTVDTDEMTYWWAWNQNAFKALVEFNQAECATAFHNRDGEFSWRPRDYAHERTMAVDQSEILADIARPNPWDVVRNVVRVHSSPKELNDCNEILWQLRGTPAIADGETFHIEPIFKYEEWQPCGAAIAFGFTVNAAAGGGGADLTADCDLEYDTDIGEGARLWLTNNSGTDGYITLLKATGDAIYAPSIDVREAADTDSQDDYGPKALEIKSRWVEDTEQAKILADWLLLELADPRDAPVIQLENRSALQFVPDLYDRIVLDLPYLDSLGQYRIGAIEHQWLNENGQGVRTTMRLEPYMQYPGGDLVTYQGTQVIRSANQAIDHDTDTEILWDAEDHDVGSYHSLISNTDRVTIPSGKDGYYAISCTIQWAGHATGGRLLRIQKNGATLREAVTDDISEAETFDQHCHQTVSLAAGDWVTVEVKQTSGGALNVQAESVLSVDFLGA